jgi:hypothetical protein
MRLLKPIIAVALIIAPGAVAQQSPPATAWKSGHFVVDTAGLLSRSDIVLAQPNPLPEEAMPLGNGRLGVAVWSAGGLTAQLNRPDTLPHRDSPLLLPPGISAVVWISTTEPWSNTAEALPSPPGCRYRRIPSSSM